MIINQHVTMPLIRGIVKRMRKINLILPKESMWKKIINAAQVAGLDVPDADTSVAYKKSMKAMLSRETSPSEKIDVVSFPVDPRELACFKTAYEGDPPMSLDEAAVLGKNSTIRGGGKKNPKAVPMISTEALEPEKDFMNKATLMWNMFNMVQANASGASSSGVGALAGFRPAGAPGRRPKMLGDVPPANAAEKQPAVEAPQTLALEDAQENAATECAPMDVKKPEHSVLLDEPPALDAGKKSVAPKASAKASPKGKAKAKAKAKTGSKGSKVKSKPASATPKGAKPSQVIKQESKTAKATQVIKCKKGWLMEVRTRASGQRDKHYRSPNGQWYRIQGEAAAAGFPGEP